MKALWMSIALLLIGSTVRTNEGAVHTLAAGNKLVIVTLDGYRWQELFTGADSALIHHPAYTTDTAYSKALYWAATATERRKKLMPFFWNHLAVQGALYGNRLYSNCVNVANPFALSYPGYNEILTGAVDMTLFSNGKAINKNVSVLEMLNTTKTYRGKVAAFTSWDAFPYILNAARNDIHLNSGFAPITGNYLTPTEVAINQVQENIEDKKITRYDELTYIACREYIQKKQPSVVFLSLGGTDEMAHQKKYDQYLQQANNADRMIGELWQYLQTLPAYAGQTTLLVTTDHGRGNKPSTWSTHGLLTSGSSQTWVAMLGRHISATGEQKAPAQRYQKELKEQMLSWMAKP